MLAPRHPVLLVVCVRKHAVWCDSRGAGGERQRGYRQYEQELFHRALFRYVDDPNVAGFGPVETGGIGEARVAVALLVEPDVLQCDLHVVARYGVEELI